MAGRSIVCGGDRGDLPVAIRLGADDAYGFLFRFSGRPHLAVDAVVEALDSSQVEPGAVTTYLESAQSAIDVAPKRAPPGYRGIIGFAFLLGLLLGVATPVALLIWQAVTTTVAVRSGDAGTFVSATASQGGFFTSTLTNVQTTTGSVVVQGTFSAPRGRALAIEDLNKTGLHLCAVGDLDTCLPISGHWAGHLVPTLQAARVFNFVRYGLSTYNLQRWMAFGLIFAFVALALVFACAVARRS